MKKDNKITRELALYGLIFLAALALRLINLGRVPLLESEANWAIQAWQLSLKESIPVGSQVGYLSITEGLFKLFEGSNFLARLWPAVIGSLLIWLPFYFREELNRVPALVLAAGLALDPALVPVSRQAGGPMPALVFLALAVGTFHARKITWGFFFLGMGLFSGPDFWTGFLLLLISALVSMRLDLFNARDYFKVRLENFQKGSENWLTTIIPALLGLLVIGTFFFRNYQGLVAWAGSLGDFVRSLGGPAGLRTGKFVVYFLINNPLILVFGVVGFVAAWLSGERFGKGLSIWFAVSLLGLLIYPQRQAFDQIWLVLPLWISTATIMVHFFRLAPNTWVTHTLAGLVVTLASLNWLTLIGLIFRGTNQNTLLLELGLFLASLALLILSSTVVSSEWGLNFAWKGLVTGGAFALLLFLISSLSLDAYVRDKDPRAIFTEGSGKGQMKLLVDSIADASITATGRPDSIQGAVIGDSDALRWALREYEEVDFLINPLSGMEYPFLITTGEGDIPEMQENYRGQDFVLSSAPGWEGVLPNNWISWIAFREGPITTEYLILWVRNDIYSGY